MAENEPIVIEEIRLSTVADVTVPSQTAQKQPEAVKPDVPKIDQAQQEVAVVRTDIVEIEPKDHDEVFSDI